MPTVAEQTAILQTYLANGQYPDAYNYISTQITGDPAWNQSLPGWFESAATINSTEPSYIPNFLKDWVFTSNIIAMNDAHASNVDPFSAGAAQLNQQVSDQLAEQIINDYITAIEQGGVLSPETIYYTDVDAAATGFNIPESAWAGGPLAGPLYDFPVGEVYDTPQEVLDWLTNSIKTGEALIEKYGDKALHTVAQAVDGVLQLIGDFANEASETLSNLFHRIDRLWDYPNWLPGPDGGGGGGGSGGGGSGGGGGGGSDGGGGSGGHGGDGGGNYPPDNKPQPYDPLILDLDGDGIRLIAPIEGSAQFDIDNDGFRELMGWVGDGDGFLALDSNSNGVIDAAAELFGTDSLTGHEHLAQFDSNSDGKINSADPVWAALRVWVDTDADGISDAQELFTLDQLNVSSLSLTATAQSESQAGGEIVSMADVQFADGHHSSSYSVNLLVNQAITEQTLPEGFEFDPRTVVLPTLAGVGNLPDLKVAMSLDAVLLQMVEDLVSKDRSLGFDSFFVDAKDILFRWAQVDGLDPAGRGTGIDGREVAVVELITGDTYPELLNLQRGYGPTVEHYFDQFFDALFSRLMGQLWESKWLSLQATDPSALFEPGVASDPLMLLFGGLLSDGRFVDQNLARNLVEIGDSLRSSGPIDHDEITQLVLPTLRVMLADRYGSVDESYGELMWLIANLQNVDTEAAGIGWAALTDGTHVIGTDFNDVIVAGGTDASLVAGGGDDTLTAGSKQTLLSGGDGADHIDGGSANDLLLGGKGNDVLTGRGGLDILVGGQGDDLLSGSGQSDTYTIGLGDGHDTIDDATYNFGADGGSADTIEFGDGITPDMIVVTQAEGGSSLLLTVGIAGDTVLIKSTMVNPLDRIEFVTFADGTTWTHADLVEMSMSDNAGNNTFYGSFNGESIRGGTGNDALYGGDGSDSYVWARGDGNDTITETINFGDADRLVLEGVNPAAATITRSGSTLILTIAESATGLGDGGVITMADSFDGEFAKGVEQIVFGDGTTWTNADLRSRWLASVSTSGSDTITAFSTADTIRAGAGNDTLNGGASSDTYIWARGDGSDTITETINNGSADKLILEGINPSSVTIGRSGSILILTIAESTPGAGNGGVITMPDSFDGEFARGVEQVVFADGSIWTKADMCARWLTSVSTSGNDTINGFINADTIQAGAGNDTLNGGDGNDTYIWARGHGSDTITETINNGTADQLVLQGINPADVTVTRNVDNITLTIRESSAGAGNGGTIILVNSLDSSYENGVEQIRFADNTVWTQATLRSMVVSAAGTPGNDTITGTTAADVIRGGAGNDTINGGASSDTYLWSRGDGNDTITETINNGAADRLILEGVNPADVTVARNGSILVLTVAESAPGAGNGGIITMADSFDGDFAKGVEQIAFGDGTVWTYADVRTKWLASVSTAGNDNITGFSAADTIRAGGGNDTLAGGTGNDIYIWARGDGSDTVTENVSSGTDQLVLEGVNPAQVTVGRSGSTLLLTVAESAPGAGDGGTISMASSFDGATGTGVEQFVFADGTVWTNADVRALWLASAATSGNDTIAGFSTADTIRGGAGNDALAGAQGNDIYIWARGDGNDTITENTSSGTDQLVLDGVSPADVTVGRSGGIVILTITESAPGAGNGGTITMPDSFDGEFSKGVEQVVFGNGTVWSRADLITQYLASAPTGGNDTISGFASADTIHGGAGNDTLSGGDGADIIYGDDGNDFIYGNNHNDTLIGGLGNDRLEGASGVDTYMYNLGDGDDVIYDTSADTAGNETLVFGAGITAADLIFTRSTSDTDDLIITFKNGAGSILLDEQYTANAGVELIQFSDGSTLAQAYFLPGG
jgi:Ca2+-binding RTX toxin-like protein